MKALLRMPSVGLLSCFFAIFELLFCSFVVALLFADSLAAARASFYRCSNNLAAFGFLLTSTLGPCCASWLLCGSDGLYSQN